MAVSPLLIKIMADAADAQAAFRQVGDALKGVDAGAETVAGSFARVQQAAASAATDMQRLINFSTGLQSQTGMTAAETLAYGRALDDVRARFNPLFAASRRYEKELLDIAAAEQMGAISAREAAEARNRAALSMAPASQAVVLANVGIARSAGAARADVANLAAQFQDIGVMLAAGQSPLLLAMQQGTQISAVLGQQGAAGAARALGGALKAIVSPVSLITIATIAAGAAIFQWAIGIGRAEDEAKTFEDRIRGVTDAIRDYQEFAEAAQESTEELREKFGAFAEDARRLQGLLAESALARAFDELRTSMDPIQGDIEATLDLFEEAKVVATQLEELRRNNPDFESTLLGQDTAARFRAIYEEAAQITQELGLTVMEVDGLAAALARVENAGTMQELRDEANQAATYIRSLYESGADIPAPLREAMTALAEIALQAGRAAGQGDDMAAAFQRAAVEASSISANFQAAMAARRQMEYMLGQGLTPGVTSHPGRMAGTGVGDGLTRSEWEAGYAARAGTPAGVDEEALVRAVTYWSARTGLDAQNVLTVMRRESDWRHWRIGGQDNNYQGLIQFSPDNRQRYGVSAQSSVEDQVAASFQYMLDHEVRPGDHPARYYAAVLAGDADRIHAGDINNGGRVSSIVEEVAGEGWAEAYEQSGALLAGYAGVVQEVTESVQAGERAQEEAATGAERAADAYQALRDRLMPAAAATRNLAEEQALINAEFAAGRITAEEQTEMLRLVAEQAQRTADNINGVADATRSIQAEAQRGSDAITDLLTGVAKGGDAAKQALAQIIAQLARVQIMKGVLGLAGTDSGIGGFIRNLGGALTMPTATAIAAAPMVPSPRLALASSPAVMGGAQLAAMSLAAASAPQEIVINVHGARGNREIEDMVQRGVVAGMQAQDRAAPARVRAIINDPRRR